MEKTVTIQRNKVFFSVLLSIFIFSAFFLNYLNVSAASGRCSLFGCGDVVFGCCHTTQCCNVPVGYNCGGNPCGCTPNCTGKTCGDDGCGGSCGTCSSGYTCSNGSCVGSSSGCSTNGEVRSCSVSSCPGHQRCLNGQWDYCRKDDPCCNQPCPAGSTCVIDHNVADGYICVKPCTDCEAIKCGECKGSMGYKCKCSNSVSGGYETCTLESDLSCCKDPCYIENGICKIDALGKCGTWYKTCGSNGFMCCEDGCNPGLSCCDTTIVVNGVVKPGPKTCLAECPGNSISSNRYSCNTSTGICYKDSNGAYSSLSTCNASCGVSDNYCPGGNDCYSCDKTTGECYSNDKGVYSDLSLCQKLCVVGGDDSSVTTTTTISDGNGSSSGICMIDKFELPERAWVGYPLTGEWSASDWCDDCDVSCEPYPDCVWSAEGIGIGLDKFQFTLSNPGDYTYTLKCYGQGEDEATAEATVQALHLPWWREIIPVLPGFLRGLWD